MIHNQFAVSALVALVALVGKYASYRGMIRSQLACFDNMDASNKGNMTGCPLATSMKADTVCCAGSRQTPGCRSTQSGSQDTGRFRR